MHVLHVHVHTRTCTGLSTGSSLKAVLLVYGPSRRLDNRVIRRDNSSSSCVTVVVVLLRHTRDVIKRRLCLKGRGNKRRRQLYGAGRPGRTQRRPPDD